MVGYKWGLDRYDLYDKAAAVPVRTMSEARRRAGLPDCDHCGRKIEPEDDTSFYGEYMGDYRDVHRDCAKQLAEREKRYEAEAQAAYEREQAEVIAWMQQKLAQDSIIIDVHTADVYGEVVDVCVLHVDGRVLIDERFKPLGEIEEGATAVHGLTLEMLADRPLFSTVHERLKEVCDSAENVLFYGHWHDARCIDESCEAHDLPSLKLSRLEREDVCVMNQVGIYYGVEHGYHYDRREREPYGERSALGDCRGTLGLMERMARQQQTAAAATATNENQPPLA